MTRTKKTEYDGPAPAFTYPMYAYVSCRSCGTFTSITFKPPLPKESLLMKPHFCPHCGAPYEYDPRYANDGGRGFLLADVMLSRQVTLEELKQFQDIYGMWDIRVHSTFKEFLQSLRES